MNSSIETINSHTLNIMNFNKEKWQYRRTLIDAGMTTAAVAAIAYFGAKAIAKKYA